MLNEFIQIFIRAHCLKRTAVRRPRPLACGGALLRSVPAVVNPCPQMSPPGCTVLSGRRARPAAGAGAIIRASRSIGGCGPATAGDPRSTAAAPRARSAAPTRAARLREARLELLGSEGDDPGPRTPGPTGAAPFREAASSSAQSIETPYSCCSSTHPPAQTPAAADPAASEGLPVPAGAL